MACQPALRDFPYHGTSHSGMYYAVQHLSFAFIVEDDFTDGLSVEGDSVRLENSVGSEVGNDCLVASSAGKNDGTGEVIGIDDGEIVPR
jgi:hypothetical protein